MAEAEEPKGAAADDIRHDDLEYNPKHEPEKAKAWLNLLSESEKAFEKWNDHCDKIESSMPTSSGCPAWRGTKSSRCSGPTAR